MDAAATGWVERWLDHLRFERRLSPLTVKNYHRDIEALYTFLCNAEVATGPAWTAGTCAPSRPGCTAAARRRAASSGAWRRAQPVRVPAARGRGHRQSRASTSPRPRRGACPRRSTPTPWAPAGRARRSPDRHARPRDHGAVLFLRPAAGRAGGLQITDVDLARAPCGSPARAPRRASCRWARRPARRCATGSRSGRSWRSRPR
jgi:hypothetical protein